MAVTLPDKDVRIFVEQLTTLRRDVDVLLGASRSAGLGQSTINNGAIAVVDGAGMYRGSIGMAADGSFAVVAKNGPPPSETSNPQLTSVIQGLLAKWDGAFTNTERPADLSHVEVHHGTINDPEHPSTVFDGTLTEPGDWAIAPLTPGVTYYVWFRAVNTSGKKSNFSVSVSASPLQNVAQDLLDGIVTELKVANNAITGAKVAVNAITVTKISDDAVTSPKIIANGVQAGNIAANAVVADKIATNAITADKILANAVTADKVAANAITAGKIEAGSITAVKLATTLILTTTIIAGTSSVGARVQIDSAGIRAFNSLGLQTFIVSGATGAVEMLGKLTAGASTTTGDRVTVDPAFTAPGKESIYGSRPGISFVSANSTAGAASIFSSGNNESTNKLVLQSGPSQTGPTFQLSTVTLDIGSVTAQVFNATGVNLGGKVTASLSTASLEFDGRQIGNPNTSSFRLEPNFIISEFYGNQPVPFIATRILQDIDSFDIGVFAQTSNLTRDGGFLILEKATGTQWFGKSNPNSANVQILSSGLVAINTGVNAGIQLNTGGPEIVANNVFRATKFISGAAANLAALGGPGAGGDLYLGFNGTQGQILRADTNAVVKTFVINHPSPKKKDTHYLVHGTIEGPEASVLYRGIAHLEDGTEVVELPDWFEDLVHVEGRTVHLTPMWADGNRGRPKRKKEKYKNPNYNVKPPEFGIPTLAPTYPVDGAFRIVAMGDCPETLEVFYMVMGVRKDVPSLEVEPLKSSGTVRGDGPYTWIGKN